MWILTENRTSPLSKVLGFDNSWKTRALTFYHWVKENLKISQAIVRSLYDKHRLYTLVTHSTINVGNFPLTLLPVRVCLGFDVQSSSQQKIRTLEARWRKSKRQWRPTSRYPPQSIQVERLPGGDLAEPRQEWVVSANETRKNSLLNKTNYDHYIEGAIGIFFQEESTTL